MLKSTIEIHRQKRENDLICKALAPDTISTDRAKITITSKECLKIDIESQDTTSLRAAVNTILRQIKLIEDTIKLSDTNDTRR